MFSEANLEQHASNTLSHKLVSLTPLLLPLQ